MLKVLAILVLASAMVGLSSSPTKRLSTPEQRISKPNGGESGKEQANAKDKNQSSAKVPPITVQVNAPVDENAKEQARENLDIERKVEWFTGVLAVVGALQAWLLFGTLGAIKRQADLMHQSLVATFRPKLLVRKVSVHKGDGIGRCGLDQSGAFVNLPDIDSWRIDFSIFNAGGSTAQNITRSFAVDTFTEGIPVNLPYIQVTETKFSLGPGEEKWFSIELSKDLSDYYRAFMYSQWADKQALGHVYFFGFCRYEDRLGLPRGVAVLRHYQTHTKKFKPSDDPDYEYAD